MNEMIQRDIRETDLFQEADALYKALRQPLTGRLSEAADVEVSPDGAHVVFTGTLAENLEGTPPTRICRTDLATGDTRVLTFGPHSDRLPKYSPQGRQIAFLSDRHARGDFQLYLYDSTTGAAEITALPEGWVEYFHWSPDGRSVLLGVAGYGADISGGQGAIASGQRVQDCPSWMPTVEAGDESFRWRRVWVYDVAANTVRRVSSNDRNVWEAVWCGEGAIAAIVSTGPSEGLWYRATLELIDIGTGAHRELYRPKDQLGWPAATLSGRHLAVVEAVCSDRWIVAGDVKLIDIASGEIATLDTKGIDVTHAEWRSEASLLLSGHRGFDTLTAVWDANTRVAREVWTSRELTGAGRYVSVSGLGETGDFVVIAESFLRAPEVGVVQAGMYRTVKSLGMKCGEPTQKDLSVDCLTWQAPDGIEIQGWLLRPKESGPHPLVMYVHGGPVWHWRPAWLGRPRSMPLIMLLDRGYAVFLPNPRGSSGRGQEFTRRVVGDMGGLDTYDCLSGLDHLIAQGIADPHRLGVMGVSYGGFMASWLITQDSRFAAAVPIAPVTNQVTEHLISNIPHFVELFLADHYSNPTGKYFQRSPIMFASRVKTPTLNICGALDRCTPPTEAMQFHKALLENGVESMLATYPLEGHGIHSYPATVDFAARVVGWFQRFMG
jgi:dipeptidyl aminopeptidase/acylaminoacyl peptidase